MCGRYFIDYDSILEYNVDTAQTAATDGIDICPGMAAPVLTAASATPVKGLMRWGFEKEDGGLVINARVETIGQKAMFRGLIDSQRCAMPAAHYYEWRRSDRQKFNIELEGLSRFWLAGLFRLGSNGPEFVVLTQPPVSAIQAIHNRMPLILPEAGDVARWLGGETRLFSDSGAIRLHADGPEQLSMSL